MSETTRPDGAARSRRPPPRQPLPEPSRTVRTARTAAHLVAEGLRGLLVAPGQVLACFLSLAVASCLVTLFAACGSLAVRLLDRATERTCLLVYLKEGVASDRVQAVIEGLRERPDVADARYFSAGEDRARNRAHTASRSGSRGPRTAPPMSRVSRRSSRGSRRWTSSRVRPWAPTASGPSRPPCASPGPQ